MESAATRPLSEVDLQRLCLLACIHDIGKVIPSFQDRIDPGSPFQGHIKPMGSVFGGGGAAGQVSALILSAIAAWTPSNDFLHAVFSHHGTPRGNKFFGDGLSPSALDLWKPRDGMDPVAATRSLLATASANFPLASTVDKPTLPESTAFLHLFAGLLMLADWIGSSEGLHPLVPRTSTETRHRDQSFYMRSPQRIRMAGIGVPSPISVPDAEVLIEREGVRPVQRIADLTAGQTLCVEAETGSGKTELALLHWVELRKLGLVDGLYIALPTRTSAAQIHGRVVAFVARYLGKDEASKVVLAVPGYARGGGIAPPSSDGSERDSDAAWASEHPKRYLAAAVAVGTVDQALMAVLPVPHAHMRMAALSRSLLVIDEVHASDPFGASLVATLLKAHRAIGGRSLVMSATLGADTRMSLLDVGSRPTFDEAVAVPYPCASWSSKGEVRTVPVTASRPARNTKLRELDAIDDPVRIATDALRHASFGARVLVVRNTVAGARNVLAALEVLDAGGAHAFRVSGRRALHHGRFASSDRRRLDDAVAEAFGWKGTAAGMVLVGTQTLEQSLDIDADVILTDLCPADVLIQRLGRLHRHDGRTRPAGYEEPVAYVMVPTHPVGDYLSAPTHGLGIGKDGRGVYRDLVGIEATLGCIRTTPVWSLPSDGRRLVETCTHPSALREVLETLVANDPTWATHASRLGEHVHREASAGRRSCRDMSGPFEEWSTDGTHVATRLGTRDRRVRFPDGVTGPFGHTPGPLVIPDWLVPGLQADDEPMDVRPLGDAIDFTIGGRSLRYDRYGLARTTAP